MYKEKRIMFLKALTPMHAGSGTDLNVIDLPIQREVHTLFPNIQASTLKGCIRHAYEEYSAADQNEETIKSDIIFGQEGEEEASASAISITDARLLFFPVRSAKGIFALVTCPMILKRFQRDIHLVGINHNFDIDSMGSMAVAGTHSDLFLFTQDNIPQILLDEYQYGIKFNKKFEEFCDCIGSKFGDIRLKKRAVLIPDNDFKDFAVHATSVVTRIRIGETGVAENQALFTEEYLPEESILYTLVMVKTFKNKNAEISSSEMMAVFSQLIEKDHVIQIGADETLGKGFTELYLQGGDGND